MSRGLASPPPKITSVPAAGAGSPLERWKSEDAFHQDPGGTASPAHRCRRETSGSETPQGRPLQREAPSGSQLSFFYIQSLECLSLKQTACQSL